MEEPFGHRPESGLAEPVRGAVVTNRGPQTGHEGRRADPGCTGVGHDHELDAIPGQVAVQVVDLGITAGQESHVDMGVLAVEPGRASDTEFTMIVIDHRQALRRPSGIDRRSGCRVCVAHRFRFSPS